MLPAFLRRLRARLRYRHFARDLAREIEVHRAMAQDALEGSGCGRTEAEARASRTLGNVTLAREDARAVWVARGLDALRQDLRYAVRSVVRRRGLSVAAIFMLALAISITTAMFTIVDALVLRPAPFKDAAQLAQVYLGTAQGGPSSVTSAVFAAWRASPAFAAVESASAESAPIATDAGEVIRGFASVTPGIFDLLGGVRPLRGRLFEATDGQPGSDDVVLISEDVWRALYRSDPDIVGRRIRVADRDAVVVGVLPAEFRFPRATTVVWRAASIGAAPAGAGARAVAYARFASHLPRADALQVATDGAHAADPRTSRSQARVNPIVATELSAFYRGAIPLLSGAVVLLFLVLCANVSSPLLASLMARAREFGTRAALGASRARLIRQALCESLLTCTGGLVAGARLAWALVAISRALLPQAALVQSLNQINLDTRALAAASIGGLLAALVAGVLPAIIGTRVEASPSLASAGRSATEPARARVARRGLLVCQIALSCTLLIVATLLVRSFVSLATEDRGFDASRLLLVSLSLPAGAFPTPESRSAIAALVEGEARAAPGIEAVSWSYGTTRGGAVTMDGEWRSDAEGSGSVQMTGNLLVVDAAFFDVYRIPILRGRSFLASDADEVLVGERLARALWPNQDPIGRTFSVDRRRFQVVGLTGEIRFPSLDPSLDAPQFYQRFSVPLTTATMSLRCAAVCPDAAAIRQRLASAAPTLRIESVVPLESLYTREFAQPRAVAALAFTFAATALVAAAAGLFSLLSHNVSRRRREIGIRSVLGASPADVRRLVWREALSLAAVGIGIGAIAGFSLSRFVKSLLFGVTVSDPWSWLVVVAVLAGTIAAASWRPLRTAVRTTPTFLMRAE